MANPSPHRACTNPHAFCKGDGARKVYICVAQALRCTYSLLVRPSHRFRPAVTADSGKRPPLSCLSAVTLQLQQKSGGRWPGITAAESKAESAILMPYNIWEMQSTYNEKADIWQV